MYVQLSFSLTGTQPQRHTASHMHSQHHTARRAAHSHTANTTQHCLQHTTTYKAAQQRREKDKNTDT